jgi:hypothetical protein
MKNILNLLILLVFQYLNVSAQELNASKSYNVVCVGFYNLENLFDTIVDPDVNKILQDDFTPKGDHQFTSERYHKKLQNLSKVISELGTETTPDGAAVIGVSEIENRRVLDDLVDMPLLKDRNYKIVHFESPDRRGIDVAFLYQEKYFELENSLMVPTINPEDLDWKTRGQVLMSGKIGGEPFHFIVAHWPSRRGGQKKSSPKRMLAAQLGRHMIDSIQGTDPNAKIIYMGDLNDDPTDLSLKKGLITEGKIDKVGKDDLYNPMEKFFKNGIGTLAWRDNWNLFDQLICTGNLVETGSEFSTYKFFKARVYNEPYLKVKEGNWKGYPKRTYVGTNWQGGYSDHFPVFLYIIREQ